MTRGTLKQGVTKMLAMTVLVVATGCWSLIIGTGTAGIPQGGGSGEATDIPSTETRAPTGLPASETSASGDQGASATPPATLTPHPSRTATATPIPTATASPTASLPAAAEPRVIGFSAVAHEEVELRWETTGERVTICPLTDAGLVHCRCLYDLPPSGATVIRPARIVAAYTGFELSAYSSGGRTSRRVSAHVRCPGGDGWFLQEPPAMCPASGPVASPAAAQRFERGMMVWVEATDTFYILHDHDLGVADPGQGWSSLTSMEIVEGPLALKPGASPENRIWATPPPGRFEPVSGFGLVWRGEVLGTQRVRERLGWAVEREYGFETVYQCQTPCGAHWSCYLRSPEGRAWHLTYRMHVGYYWAWW